MGHRLRARWPPRRDFGRVAGLGMCYFGLFFVVYNTAVGYTTAARASLALSTLQRARPSAAAA